MQRFEDITMLVATFATAMAISTAATAAPYGQDMDTRVNSYKVDMDADVQREQAAIIQRGQHEHDRSLEIAAYDADVDLDVYHKRTSKDCIEPVTLNNKDLQILRIKRSTSVCYTD
ncbi:MAG: hypothetical protein MRY32_08800 [Rickettsiales bacterium]|nr:hypothetical protein [Rickettsiales bacterium]